MTDRTTRIQPSDLMVRKGQTPIVCLTAYDTPMARRADAHCDLLLVGDSLAMVVYGLETTRGISLETMIGHGQAVMRGATKSCVIVDLPFGSYEASVEQAVASAKRVISETGCDGVKLEGGEEMADAVSAIVNAGIPVFGHIGLLPQKAEARDGFKIQGRDDAGAQQVMRDAKAIETAGAFAIVIEGTIEAVARDVTEAISIPTIGIGASPACDGQILVTQDMTGMFSDFTPKFVKQYANAGAVLDDAIAAYARDVRDRSFPELTHCFGVAQTNKMASD